MYLNMQISNIKKGSVIKIWAHPKGHDYVVVADNPTKKSLYLLKRNCINKDGSVHASTKKFHKTLSYSTVGSNRVLNGVTKILGETDLTNCVLGPLVSGYEGEVQVLPVNKNFVCSPVSDNTTIINLD